MREGHVDGITRSSYYRRQIGGIQVRGSGAQSEEGGKDCVIVESRVKPRSRDRKTNGK